MMTWILSILVSYLLGSVPFGLIIGRARGLDIREHGSKNIGATNTGRVLGRPWGWLCFALDLLKGALPVIAAGWVTGALGRSPADLDAIVMWLWLAVAIAAVIGHMFPLYLGFRGGKGVATGFGALVAMWPLLTGPTLGALLAWYLALRLTEYVSVASMVAATLLPLLYLLMLLVPMPADPAGAIAHASPPLIVTLALAGLVIYKHRGNIARLRGGEEPKTAATVKKRAGE